MPHVPQETFGDPIEKRNKLLGKKENNKRRSYSSFLPGIDSIRRVSGCSKIMPSDIGCARLNRIPPMCTFPESGTLSNPRPSNQRIEKRWALRAQMRRPPYCFQDSAAVEESKESWGAGYICWVRPKERLLTQEMEQNAKAGESEGFSV